MNRQKVLAELWEKSEGRCARCGRRLEVQEGVIDHIFPRAYGGSDHIGNLRLLCRQCNCVVADHSPVDKSEVQKYLQQLLSCDSRFQNVRTEVCLEAENGESTVFDIMFSRVLDGKERQYIVEVKGPSAATEQKIESAVRELKQYQGSYPEIQFILAIPSFLAENYRQSVRAAGFVLWDSESIRLGMPDIEPPVCAVPDQYDMLIDRLKRCKPGRGEWQVYQKLVGEILSALFCPPLDPVSEQNADGNYKNRRDFVLPNYSADGYWPYLRERYQAEFIVVDAKNSAAGVKKDDILQVAHYLKKDGTGLFGIICSRRAMEDTAQAHLRDVWITDKKMIVILGDSDIEQMLLNKQKGVDPCQILIEKIREFRLKI